jgi:hypothetical protein
VRGSAVGAWVTVSGGWDFIITLAMALSAGMASSLLDL